MDLKPCPFCGDQPVGKVDAPNDEYWISCENEECTMSPAVASRSIARAHELWNRRAPALRRTSMEIKFCPGCDKEWTDVSTPQSERE